VTSVVALSLAITIPQAVAVAALPSNLTYLVSSEVEVNE